jgi:hypothetical protein
MGKKRRIDKRDKKRVLRTEVLPFETPLFFSNEIFYEALAEEKLTAAPELIKNIFLRKDYTVPFSYRIKKNNDSERTISLMHPAAQIEVVNFYEKYDTRITYLCRKSPYSVRAPTAIASSFYEPAFATWRRKLISTDVESDAGGFEPDEVYASSYFKYGDITHLYKFFDSRDFLDLEVKFSALLKFDVSHCFESIYTHSMSWAVKDKFFSKLNKGKDSSFESSFDVLMQHSNYNETNGILVGSEVSRIFAEIILQKIDLNILSETKAAGVAAESFTIRRYVDDFFVFADNMDTCDQIFAIARRQLDFYKLFVNEKKTLRSSRPFLSAVSLAKSLTKKLVAERVTAPTKDIIDPPDKVVDGQAKRGTSRRRVSVAGELIGELRQLVQSTGVDFGAVASYFLSAVARNLHRYSFRLIASSMKNANSRAIEAHLVSLMDACFYAFVMDRRAYTCYLVCQIVIIVERIELRLAEQTGSAKRAGIDHLVRCIKDLVRSGHGGVEVSNLVVALSAVSDSFDLSEFEVSGIIGAERRDQSYNVEGVDYFGLIAALRYIERNERYASLYQAILKAVVAKLDTVEDPSIFCEKVLLFVDILTCPHVDADAKRAIAALMYERCLGRPPKQDDAGRIVNYVAANLGFTEWTKRLTIERMLERKALKVSY